jgi:hypothetical protein
MEPHIGRSRAIGRLRRVRIGVSVLVLAASVFGSGYPSSARANVTTYPDTHKWVDSCVIPSDAALGNWYNGTPLYNWGMYIGGEEAAAVGCGIWSGTKAATARTLHWALVPIWDGLQAPCSGNAALMSSNATTAHSQGVTAANNAATAFFARGFLHGQFIYLDMEGYPGGTSCRDAVKSFVSGWITQLHAQAIFAGVYGSSCSSYPTDWLGLTVGPDSVWLADYNLVASVWGLSCVPNSDWSDDYRHHQYRAGHSETWGGSTINPVDDDCAAGYVDKDVPDGTVYDPDTGVTEGNASTDEPSC